MWWMYENGGVWEWGECMRMVNVCGGVCKNVWECGECMRAKD